MSVMKHLPFLDVFILCHMQVELAPLAAPQIRSVESEINTPVAFTTRPAATSLALAQWTANGFWIPDRSSDEWKAAVVGNVALLLAGELLVRQCIGTSVALTSGSGNSSGS
jgi:hypothetical protein